jgi:hypothetical protein
MIEKSYTHITSFDISIGFQMPATVVIIMFLILDVLWDEWIRFAR